MVRRMVLCLVFACAGRAAWPQGDPLGPEFRVNTYTTSTQALPDVASGDAGDFVVVWSGQDGSGLGVFGQRYAASGNPLGGEFPVNTYTTDHEYFPTVASSAAGGFVVVWMSDNQDGSGRGIFGRRYSASGSPLGGEFRVNTYTAGSQDSPSVTADSSGDFVVVWQSYSQDGSDVGVFAQRYADTGVPLGPEFRVNTFTTGLQFGPEVASDPSGNFVVLWISRAQDGSNDGVFGQRFASSGVPLGPEFRVNTYTTGAQITSSVAAASGVFVTVWSSRDEDGSFYGLQGQRYSSSGAPVGPAFRVNTYTTSNQIFPSVAADPSGNFVVVWQSLGQDGSDYGTFGQRYSNVGVPLGPEFRANTYTSSAQRDPSVAADAAGNFVVVWESSAQDGSSQGVFGQRFSQIVPVELMHLTIE
jgi:hypothetical protein